MSDADQDRGARSWLTAHARKREAEILGSTASDSTRSVRERLLALAVKNRQIHQEQCINLNPAANVMSPAAETAAASAGLSTRPSLGHAGEKYEMGLEAVEQIEVIAADLACQVFDARFAEVRPTSGAMSNMIAFMASCSPGDSIIVPPASIGGHVTHNVEGVAGLLGLNIHEAPIDPDRYTVDVAGVAALARQVAPRMITIGTSLNLLPHPVPELREVADEVGAVLMFDAAHACGMFAGRQWSNPLDEGAHVMTMSTYKSLAGPAGGLMVTNDATLAERFDEITYPGLTANFDAGRVAALAVTLTEWIDQGREYATEMVSSAHALASELINLDVNVFATIEGPTTSHQFAVRSNDGHALAQRLRLANLLTSAIGLPDGEGVRFGVPEAVRWGMTTADMAQIATFVARAVHDEPEMVAAEVASFRARFTNVHFCSSGP